MNSRNAGRWGSAAPDNVLTKPLHFRKATAWMAMKGVSCPIGPFSSKMRVGGVPQTVNAERYLNAALKPFWKEIKRRDSVGMGRVWMQQHVATPHTARDSMAWLQEHFPGRLINLKAEVGWAPHSTDLSPFTVFSRAISWIEPTRASHEQ